MLNAGAFRIDLESERLWHGAEAVTLRPKTWGVLLCLIEQAGRLVGKQDLLDRVWEGTAIEEKTLNASIAELRVAFGDSARAPRYIETVHRRGFRFIAELDSTDGAAAAPAATPSAVTQLSSDASPFVGREDEIRKLKAALDGLGAGRGGIVCIGGPAGVGKSRLVRELLGDGRYDGEVLVGRCIDGDAVPYWPWVEMIRIYLRLVSPEAVRAACGDAAVELGRLVSTLRGNDDAVVRPTPDPDLARLRLLDALGRFLESVASGRPLVLVIEDLHWADTPSLRTLQALAPRLIERPALVIVTLRDDEVEVDSRVREVVAALARQGTFVELRLQGLEPPSARTLVQALSGDQVPVALAEQIVAASDGNPFFIEETLRHLGELTLLDPGVGWRSHLLEERITLPTSVAEVFTRRVRRVSTECRQLLDVAAVIGIEADEWLLAAALGVEEQVLAAQLDEALGAGFLREVVAHPGRYRFGHALMRFILYKSLSAPQRRRWHRCVADAIEAVQGDQGTALLDLAFHLCRAVPAVPAERAVEVALRSAEQARAQLAYESEAELLGRAFELAKVASTPVLRSRCAELAVLHAEAVQRAGDAGAAATAFRNAAELAREHNDPSLLARAALGISTPWEFEDLEVHPELEEALERLGDGDARLRTRLLARLAVVLYPQPGTRSRCEALCTEAMARARRIGDPALLGQTLIDWLAAQWYPDNLAAQQLVTEEVMVAAESSGDLGLRAKAHGWRAVIAFGTGALSQAEREIAAAAALAAQMRQPIHEWYSTYLGATLASVRGDLAGAERLAQEAFQIGQRCSPQAAGRAYVAQHLGVLLEQDRVGEYLAQWTEFPAIDVLVWSLPVLLLEAERIDDARAAFATACDRGLDAMPGDNSRNRQLTSLGAMAMASVMLKETAVGEELYERILPHTGRWAVSGWGIDCYGSLAGYAAVLAGSLRRFAPAERHFEAALAAHESAGAMVALARTCYQFATMLLERRRGADLTRARGLLERATEISRDLGLARIARRVASLPSAT